MKLAISKNFRLSSIVHLNNIMCWVDYSGGHRRDIGLEETASHDFYNCPHVRSSWDYVGSLMARIAPDQLVSIDLAYACANVSPPFSGVKQIMFLTWKEWWYGRDEWKESCDMNIILWASAQDEDQTW